MQRLIRNQRDASWTYITRMEHDVKAAEERYQPAHPLWRGPRSGDRPRVVAAVVINTDAGEAPTWVADWGWAVLVATFAAGGLATAALVATEVWHRSVKALRETERSRQTVLQTVKPVQVHHVGGGLYY